jgi:hypothetical protein
MCVWFDSTCPVSALIRTWRLSSLDQSICPAYDVETMRIFESIQENLGALIVATIAAFFAALGGWFLTIFVGAKFFRDEWSYGIPLAFGIPAALVASVAAFLVVFRKLR